jgi:hypothetical protein
METKVGFKTTEFWTTLSIALSSVLVAAGVFGSDVDPEAVGASITSIIAAVEGAIALIAGAIATGMYSQSRAKAKNGGK